MQLRLNGVPVGDGMVPDQPTLSFPADASLITPGSQTIGLRAVNLNDAHYTVAENFALQMNVSYQGTVCATADDLQLAQAAPLVCPDLGGGGGLPGPTTCSRTVTAGVNVRDFPSTSGNIIGSIPQGTSITIIGRTEGSPVERWYKIPEEASHEERWVSGEFVDQPCDNVTIYVGPDLFTATPSPTLSPTFTPTDGPSPTPSATPTSIPRIVETQAQDFHNHARQFGLPAPFTLWPVVNADDVQYGYGPNSYVYFGEGGACLTPPAPTATTAPEPTAGPAPTRIPDNCQYRNTNRIHTGMD